MPNPKLSPEQDLPLSEGGLIFWEHEKKARMLLLGRDPYPENPRREHDNLTVMACFHPRYDLGDEIKGKTPGEFWDAFLRENLPDDALLEKLQNHEIKGFEALMRKEGMEWNNPGDILDLFHDAVKDGEIRIAMDALEDRAAWLPLYLYDHSGITISCGDQACPYNDKWDAGQIGWIIVAKDDIENASGKDEKNWRKKAGACMKEEVRCYDDYLTGNVWYYILYRSELALGTNETSKAAGNEKPVSTENDWTECGSCSGFSGSCLLDSGIPDCVGEGLGEALASGDYWTGKTSTLQCYIRNPQ